ncbi:MAG: hypothetical protein PHI73_00360 [Patescibacteria group bacterium]|nr:hypothetical protein [Patescibacteria group bacterium]
MKTGLWSGENRVLIPLIVVVLGGLSLFSISLTGGCQKRDHQPMKAPEILAVSGALFEEQTLPAAIFRTGARDSLERSEARLCSISGMRLEKRADLIVWLVIDFDALRYRHPGGPFEIDGSYSWECPASHVIAQPAYYGRPGNTSGYRLWFDNWPSDCDEIDMIPIENQVARWIYLRDR